MDCQNSEQTSQTQYHGEVSTLDVRSTLALVEKRINIQLSNADPDQIEKVKNEIKRTCKRNKNENINNLCAELEKHANENRFKELYNKVKYLARKFKVKTQIIK